MSVSKFREDVYRLIDQVIETGLPLEIERKGTVLEVVAKTRPSKLERLKASRLKREPIMSEEDLESIVHIDWSSEWRPVL